MAYSFDSGRTAARNELPALLALTPEGLAGFDSMG